MRKKTNIPSRMSYRQFIFGEGRADALQRTARIMEEDERARKELTERKRRRQEQESSDRAEERNREDAERSARTNVSDRKQNARRNVFEDLASAPFRSAGEKEYISDADYERLTAPKLTSPQEDNRKWYQKAADFVFDGIDRLTGELSRFMPGGISLTGDASQHRTPEHDIVSSALQSIADWQDERSKKRELSKYSLEALNAAEERLNKKRQSNFELQDDFDALDQEQQQSIIQRELDYRQLVGPSQETIATTEQAAQEYITNRKRSVNQPNNYFDPEIKHDRYGRIYYTQSPWMKDAWSQAMQNMNTAQRDNFVGMDVRYQEKKNRAQNAEKYYQAEINVQELPIRIKLLEDLMSGKQLSEQQIAYIQGQSNTVLLPSMYENLHQDLNNQLVQSYGDLRRYKKDSEFIESYDPKIKTKFIKNPINWFQDLVNNTGTRISNFIDDATKDWYDLSYMSNIADEVNALDWNLSGISDGIPEQKLQIIQKFIEKGDKKSERWKKAANQNQEDIDRWKNWHDVSDYFKYREETSDGAFYKPGTWLYKQPGLWGSSQSSWIKQSSSMAINTAAALASGGTTRFVGGATGFGVAMSSSSDENNAEVAENFKTRFKQSLQNKNLERQFLNSRPGQKENKKSLDDAVDEYMLDPWEFGNRQLDETLFNSMYGANSLYQDDMAAVVGDNIIETYLQISPLAHFARASKPSSIVKIASSAGSKTAVLGPGASAAAFATTAFGTAAKRKIANTAAGKAIAKQANEVVQFAKKVPTRLLGEERYKKALATAKKANKNVFGSNSAPRRVLTAEQYVKYEALRDYAKDVAQATARSAIAEGIEEGKQYLHGKQFIRGEYDDDIRKSLLDVGRLVNDTKAGIQSAIAMASLLPIMPALTDDAEFIENIKGGMLGGMFQTGVQRTVYGSIPTAQRIKMQDFVANEIALEKQAQRDVYEKAKVYAKKAKDSQASRRLILAFDKYAEAVQNLLDNESEGISKEDVDLIKEQKKQAQRVINIANDSRVIENAKQMGIDTNSEQYNQYVGTIAMYQDSKEEALNRNKDAETELQFIISQIQAPYELTEDGKVVNNIEVANAVKLQQEVNMNDSNGNPLTGQKLLDAAISGYQKNVAVFARISVLQEMQQKLETLLSDLTDSDTDEKTLRDLRYQKNRVDRMLRQELLNIKEDSRDKVEKNSSKYIEHLNNSEEILNSARRVISSTIDVDYHDAILHGLIGNYSELEDENSKENEEDLKKAGYKKILNVINDIENSISSDRQIANNIEKDWLHQYDLLHDEYLDDIEKSRRRIYKKQDENIQDDLDDLEDEELTNYAGSFDAQINTQPELNKEDFDVPLVESDKKPYVSPQITIREKKRKYTAPSSQTIELDHTEQPITDEQNKHRSKYQKPVSQKYDITPKMQQTFAEITDLLDMLANINEIDIVQVRPETAIQAQMLEQDINEWMLRSIVSKDDGPVQIDAMANEFMHRAKVIFDTIKDEIKWGVSRDIARQIDFANKETLHREKYDLEDFNKQTTQERILFGMDVKQSFDALTQNLYKIGREIKQGLHMQDGQIDSPTTTQIDEAIATIDKLIDDAAEVGIDFTQRQLDQYNKAKKWFSENHNTDGKKSDPIIITKPADRPQPQVGPANGDVSTILSSNEYGFGVNESIAEDGTKLSDVISSPNFISEAVFSLVVTRHKQRSATVDKVSIVVKHNGKTFSPVTLNSVEMQKTEAGKEFYFSVLRAFNLHQLESGQHLAPVKISRSLGQAKHSGKFQSPVQAGLISTTKKEGVLNLYDIEFNSNQRDFGISRTRVTSNGPITYVTTPTTGGESPIVLHTFQGIRDFAGSVVMVVTRNFQEFGNNLPKIPVLLRAKKMSSGDAQLIVDIITGKYNPQGIVGRAALSEQVYIDGQNTGITGDKLISLLIPQTGIKDVGRSRVHFDVPYGTQTLQIIGRVKGDPESMEQPVREFDLSTQAGRQSFIQFAQANIDINLDNQFMSQRFGPDNIPTSHPFNQLFKQTAIVRRLKSGETITFGDSSISVDISDVINPEDSNDSRGLTGLAWMMKRGLLETDFDGFYSHALVVDTKQGVVKENDAVERKIDQLKETAPQKPEFNIEDIDQFFDKVQEDFDKKKIDEAKVRKNLARIFGNDFVDRHVSIIDAVIDTAKDGRVVGRCYHDSIVLSRQAEAGVEYHEAFHRILEIVCPKRLRKLVYNAYKSNKPNAKNKTERELAELIADDFMYYAMNKPTFKLPHSVREAYSMVKDYVNFVSNIGSFRLYLMYAVTNSGILNKILHISKDRQEVFAKIHSNGMNKVIRGKELDKVLNSAMYRELKNSMVYLIFKSQTVDIAGRNIQDLKTNEEFIRGSKVYKDWMGDPNIPQSTKDALQQIVDNWDVVRPDIVAAISKFSTDYQVKFDDENRDDAEGDEKSIAGAAIGDHTRASYEFSQFSRAGSRVKFFFSAIPDWEWTEEGITARPRIVNNNLGLPEMADSSQLFNIILNKLHDCNTYDELLHGLYMLGVSDARMMHVWKRLHDLYERKQSGIASADEIALLTQIKTLIRSAKNEFILARSQKIGGLYTIDIQITDAEYNAKQYVEEWQQLINGGTSRYISVDEDGKYKVKPPYKNNIFIRVADEIQKMATWVQDPNADAKYLKSRLVNMLQSFSIQIDGDILDFMLLNKYGSAGLNGLQKLFYDPSFGPLGFANSLRTTVDANDNLVYANINKLLLKQGFIKELANYKYAYRHAHDQLSVLATNGNRYYVISENNYITDQTNHLNRKDEYFDELCAYSYNLFETTDEDQLTSSQKIGSVVLKQLTRDEKSGGIRVITHVGFKTDQPGDAGQDYANISLRQDYIAKAAMLLRGALLFPTMSDKKTWVFLTGVNMPGLKFIVDNVTKEMILDTNINAGEIIPNEVVDQMWEYAICEYRSIKDIISNIDNIPDSKKVENFHKGPNGPQAARFSSLLGVYYGGRFIEFNRTKDDNGNPMNAQDNIEVAEKYFFNQPIDVQKRLIRELLQKQAEEELAYVESLGLIERSNGVYVNKGLDKFAIDAIVANLLKGIPRNQISIDLFNRCQDYAIRAIVADISNKHIISMQEGQRLFYGNPAAYKWKYDDDGHLIDLGTDLHKRLGGLVSTGTNNDLELEGIPTEYTCAEIDNPMVESEQLDDIRKMFTESEYRTAYLHMLQDNAGVTFDYNANEAKKLADKADSESLETIKQELGEDIVKIIEARLSKKIGDFSKNEKLKQKGIDVADGASYISDKMAENLLRMVGNWSSDIERAFKILRGEKVDGKVYTTKDIRELASAYEKVYTAVIGNQKYTAFGLRKEGNTLVPYYNKTALFPLFKCMCTGHTADLYKIMQDQNVDMVMINSSVKVGSVGSQPLDFNKLDEFKFNTYSQKYSYLRKQFNTDPKDKELMKVGTQSAKVAMLALDPGKTYKVGNKEYSGTEIRDRIMFDQNKLSDLGVQEINEEFFDEVKDENGNVVSKTLNIEKLSSVLTEELVNRGAPTEILDAVSVVEKDGKKQMKMPLAAISSLGWLQSIVVSRINKKTVDINTPGSAFIQRSVWGIDGQSIISDENIPPTINGGKPLKMINENGSMDCVLSIDFFDHLIPKIPRRDNDGHIVYQKDENGDFILDEQNNRKPEMMRMPFEQARQWLIEQGIIGGGANIFAYRIPTQAISSIHALRCVDVLPVVRDTAILPAEFTKITGSDKLYQCSNLKKSL